MNQRPFRFGVVVAPREDGAEWRRTARRIEELGYSTLLMPDVLSLLSPLPALAVAASVTSRLRVGTFVLAGPLRPPRLAAWDAHSLSVLLDGRFELGIGTGRPEVVAQAVDLLGLPREMVTRRLGLVERTIDLVRELDGERHTPVMMAVSGPRARDLAAAKADIVTLAVGPLATRAETARLTAELRAAAGDRAEAIELANNVFAVGDVVPPWMEDFLGVDAATMRERDSLSMLPGAPAAIAEELRRRRDTLGMSYVMVNAAFMEELSPVVEMLTGR